MPAGYTIFGGELQPPIEISWSGEPPVTPEQIQAQLVEAEERQLPTLTIATPASGPPLAVVGGGPSTLAHLDVLKSWDGDIWAINGTYAFLKKHGIKSTFIALDPHPIVADWAKDVDDKAMIVSRCHASVFDALKANGAEIVTFDLVNDGKANGIHSGSSTATCTVHLAIRAGNKNVTFFGCESSYIPGQTHAYQHEERAYQLIARVNNEDFLTAPDFMVQAIELSALIRDCPDFIKEQSGGLLRAMVTDPHYDVIWVSPGMLSRMTLKQGQLSETFSTPEDVPIRKVE